MCTSLFVRLRGAGNPHILFGRNMDIETHFGEWVVITPRDYPFQFRCLPALETHYAMIGMAAVQDGYPLYADAMNEKGLCMAGLHFPHNAVYVPPCGFAEEAHRIAPFELIPYLLGCCSTVSEVKAALDGLVISDIHFSAALPNTPLHWHVAAPDGGMIMEATATGLQLYDDHFGVLTNNPPYPYHVANLHRYDGLDSQTPPLVRADGTPLGNTYDLGLGMVGLPGDYTSPARFVRCATLRRLTDWSVSGEAAIARFFSLLGAVAPPVGCVRTPEGESHATRYTCCMDTRARCYHVITNEKITPLSVTLTDERCDGEALWQAHA